MAETTLHIAGRDYVVRCRDGEEAHLAHLATLIEAKAVQARQGAAGMTEVRTLLFAALFLADELSDLRRKPAPPVAVPASPPVQLPFDQDDGPAAAALEALADRIEKLTLRLAAPPASA